MYFLEDELIGLRELKYSDAEGTYASWFNDVEVCKLNSHHRFPMYKKNIEEYIEDLPNNRTMIVMAVEEKESSTHIGNVSLQHIDLINRQCEIAFIFGEKKYWGKGYATRAAKLMVRHAFMELGMNRIHFGTNEDNIAMQKVGKHLGFLQAGVSRQALYKDGKYHNIIHYDLLRDEWEIV